MLNSAQKKLIEDNIDYAKKIAKKRWEGVKHKYTLDEIESCAYMGLVKAAKNFIEEKNIKFKTYCSKCINNTITKEIIDDKRFNKSRGIKLEQPIVSLNQINNENGKPVEFIVLIEDKENSFETLLNNYEVDKLLRILSDSEREIVEMYFLRDMMQEEIAELLDVNQSTVSRNIKNSLEKIRSCLTTSK